MKTNTHPADDAVTFGYLLALLACGAYAGWHAGLALFDAVSAFQGPWRYAASCCAGLLVAFLVFHAVDLAIHVWFRASRASTELHTSHRAAELPQESGAGALEGSPAKLGMTALQRSEMSEYEAFCALNAGLRGMGVDPERFALLFGQPEANPYRAAILRAVRFDPAHLPDWAARRDVWTADWEQVLLPASMGFPPVDLDSLPATPGPSA